MIELPESSSEVALLAERLRHAQLVGNRLPENQRVLENARAVGIQPREERIPARPAEWIVAIRALEPHAARGELVDVRRLREWITVAAESAVQIVGDEEEDVGARSGRVGESEGGQPEDGKAEHDTHGGIWVSLCSPAPRTA